MCDVWLIDSQPFHACLVMSGCENLLLTTILHFQATAAATRNIYKEVADRAQGLSPNTLKKGLECKKGDAACYDHTNNTGIGTVRVSRKYPAREKGPYNYAEVLHKSFIFYYQQRSGKMSPQVSSWCLLRHTSRLAGLNNPIIVSHT